MMSSSCCRTALSLISLKRFPCRWACHQQNSTSVSCVSMRMTTVFCANKLFVSYIVLEKKSSRIFPNISKITVLFLVNMGTRVAFLQMLLPLTLPRILWTSSQTTPQCLVYHSQQQEDVHPLHLCFSQQVRNTILYIVSMLKLVWHLESRQLNTTPSIKFGYSVRQIWLQCAPNLVTVCAKFGYSVRQIWLQRAPNLVTSCAKFGYSVRQIWLQCASNLVTACAKFGYSVRQIWLQCAPHIQFMTPRTDVCQHCENYQVLISKAITEGDKLTLTQQFKEHVDLAQKECQYLRCIKA